MSELEKVKSEKKYKTSNNKYENEDQLKGIKVHIFLLTEEEKFLFEPLFLFGIVYSLIHYTFLGQKDN